MNGSDFLDIAKHLLSSPLGNREEVSLRTAVSRIYYAAFLHARDLMISWGCTISDKAVHAQVSEGLKWSTDPGIIRIGRKLSELHFERKRADYDTRVVFAPDVAALRCLYGQIVPELGTRWGLLNPQRREQVLANMQREIADIQLQVGE